MIVKKRQRRLNGVDEIVVSLYAHGLTMGKTSAHFAQIYNAQVSKETIARITDKVIEEMRTWQSRPLDSMYAAIFIDAIVVKIRDGQAANRPICAAIGVRWEGEKDVLGLWAGIGGEGAKFRMIVLTDIKNRGVVGGVHSLPGLRPRDSHCDLLYERDRVAQRQVPSTGARKGHFPTEQASLKCLNLATRSLDPTGRGRTRWTTRWKPALNALAITFQDRWPAAETY